MGSVSLNPPLEASMIDCFHSGGGTHQQLESMD